MNIEKRITETARRLGEKLLTAAKRDSHFMKKHEDANNNFLLRELLASFQSIDPTFGKYLVWLANEYASGRFRIEDTGRVRSTLENFVRFKARMHRDGMSNNLTEYTLNSLEEALENYLDVELEDRFSVEIPDVQVLYDGPHGTLAIPLAEEASCVLGSGTKWCTAAHTDNMFSSYHSEETPLYIWRDKSGKKLQLWFGKNDIQIMNERDESLLPSEIAELRTVHPVLSKFFAKREERIKEVPFLAYLYALQVIGGRWPVAEEVIAADVEAALPYAKNVIGHRWIEAEGALRTDPVAITDYAYSVLRERWEDAEGILLQHGTARDLVFYAQHVLKTRWKEAEHVITAFPGHAYFYAKDVIKGRFPEGEAVIQTDPTFAYMYANNILKDRWSEAEPVIIEDPEAAYLYAACVIEDRWPEAEATIRQDEVCWRRYNEYFQEAAWRAHFRSFGNE